MTAVPYLVTPPSSLPVQLYDMKLHLRAAHDDDDLDIEAKQAGTVAMLDGWGGLLGRCILPQTWAIDATGPGPHLLPFPDAANIAADSDGDTLATETQRRAEGLCVTVTDAAQAQAVTITAEYGLPYPRLSAAETLIKLIVAREYDTMTGAEYDAITRSIQALLSALQWRRI